MFNDARLLALVLFTCIAELAAGSHPAGTS